MSNESLLSSKDVLNDQQAHWEKIYGEKKPDEVSWYQENPAMSLEIIQRVVPKTGRIIDIGGGASRLVDALLGAGYQNVSVLDISGRALEYARERLGSLAEKVSWREADVTTFAPGQAYDVWHDRAVFHFLTEEPDREKYRAALKRALPVGGHVVLAAFALEGPEKCSGLPVRRYDAVLVAQEFAGDFELLDQDSETHRTPWNTEQRFNYFLLKRVR